MYFGVAVFSFYFLCNLIFAFVFFGQGYVTFENSNHVIKSDLVDAYIYFSVFFLSFLFVSGLTLFSKAKPLTLQQSDWNGLYLVVLFSCLLSIYLTFTQGLNIAGKTNPEDASVIAKLASLLLSPDFLSPLFLTIRFFSLRKYLFLSFLFVMAMILRGWLGGIVILAAALAINYLQYPHLWPKHTKKIVLMSVICIFIFMPALQFMKYYFREPSGNFIASLAEFYSQPLAELYLTVLFDIALRFQSFDLYLLMLESMPELQVKYDNNLIVPSFLDNMPAYIFIGWNNANPFGQVFASHLVGEEVAWATHAGFLGWLHIEGAIFLTYFLIVTSLHFWLSGFFGGKPFKYIAVFYFILYFWHGWLSAYFNCIIYLFIFFTYMKIINIYNRLRIKL